MGLKGVWHMIIAPWRLCQLMEAHVSAQNALLHEVMGVTRVQAETNSRMAEFIQNLQQGMMVDGPGEGRPGLSDEEELAQWLEMQRLITGREDN